MSAPWKRVSRYMDGLIDPTWRAVVNDRGIEWVTDRFALVRTDMFSLRVTPRGDFSGDLRPAVVRKILAKRPRVSRAIYADEAWRLGVVGDDKMSAVLIRHGFAGCSASLFEPTLTPLFDACDFLRIKDGTLYGYQRRPRCADPVLVAVVQPKRWSLHFAKEKAL